MYNNWEERINDLRTIWVKTWNQRAHYNSWIKCWTNEGWIKSRIDNIKKIKKTIKTEIKVKIKEKTN